MTGIVKFRGEKPERRPISEVAGNAFCKECYKNGALPLQERWVFGKSGADDTLQNVLVYVSKGLEGKTFPPPMEAVVLDQAGCVYAPHVAAVMAGQTLEIRNSDETLHNVMAAPRKNAPFNLGMPGRGTNLERVFPVPEMKVSLQCFMHPWMQAWVHVLHHPFFAVTGADGAFTLRGLPPGEYEVSVLHEHAGFEAEPKAASLTVGAGETKAVEFVYRPRDRKE